MNISNKKMEIKKLSILIFQQIFSFFFFHLLRKKETKNKKIKIFTCNNRSNTQTERLRRGQTRRIWWRKATHYHAQLYSAFLPEKKKQKLKKLKKKWSCAHKTHTHTLWTIAISCFLLFWGLLIRSSQKK